VEVRVEAAGPADWEVVRDLRLAALRDAPEAFCATLGSELTSDEAAWRRRVSDAERTTLVARVGERPAGMAVVSVSHEEGVASTAAITGVWVAPGGRGHGVGDALLTAATDVARERGFTRVTLEVGDHNAVAQRLYARHGFAPTGRSSTMPPPKQHVTEHELARDL
jgi:ribosomal protein S18 acetylase RimI-like enzyme